MSNSPRNSFSANSKACGLSARGTSRIEGATKGSPPWLRIRRSISTERRLSSDSTRSPSKGTIYCAGFVSAAGGSIACLMLAPVTGVASDVHIAVGEFGVQFLRHGDHVPRDHLVRILVAGVIALHVAHVWQFPPSAAANFIMMPPRRPSTVNTCKFFGGGGGPFLPPSGGCARSTAEKM